MTAPNLPLPVLDIVIPVYNEEESIPLLVERLDAILPTLQGVRPNVILTDDHSTDRTPVLLKQVCSTRPNFKYLRLARNSGSHIAILAGLEAGRGDCAVFLAADLQDPPELINELLDQWRQGHHIVWAVRGQREGIHWLDLMFSSAFYWLMERLANISLPKQGSDFCLMDAAVVRALSRSKGANLFIMGEVARLGFAQKQVFYTKEERRFGRSKWNLSRKIKALADAVVSFSFTPIRFMSYIGIGFSLLGFLYALLIVVRALFFGSPVTGWASTMVVTLVIGGVQMMMMGILGEYLWRTLDESRKRPSYFIEDSFTMEEVGAPPVEVAASSAGHGQHG